MVIINELARLWMTDDGQKTVEEEDDEEDAEFFNNTNSFNVGVNDADGDYEG